MTQMNDIAGETFKMISFQLMNDKNIDNQLESTWL